MKDIYKFLIGIFSVSIIWGVEDITAYAYENSMNSYNLIESYQDQIEISEERLFSTDYIVNVAKASYWSEPNINSTRFGYVYKNDIVHVISIKYNWAKFKSNWTYKYIYAVYLTKK